MLTQIAWLVITIMAMASCGSQGISTEQSLRSGCSNRTTVVTTCTGLAENPCLNAKTSEGICVPKYVQTNYGNYYSACGLQECN